MLQLLFLVLLGADVPDRIFVIGETVKDLEVISDDTRLGMISHVASHKNRIVFMDEEQLNLWFIHLGTGEMRVFGRKGEGPGELSNKTRCLWIRDDRIHVTHRQGFRWDRFTFDGGLSATEAIPGSGELWFSGPSAKVLRDKGSFLIQSESGTVRTPGFPGAQFGVNAKGVVLGRFFMAATTTANDDTISYKIFNTKDGVLHSEDVLNKKLPNHKGGLPIDKLKLLKQMGAEPEHFFVRSVTSVVGHPLYGFLLLEYSIHPRSEPHEQFSIIHRIDPRSNIQETWRVSHKNPSGTYVFFPLDDEQWLVYGDKLRWVRVKEKSTAVKK
ncbi:hypothetical protein [Acanthopleuribacter pedis]|uniref:Uncharacterized protein n=1 Tax=Acanthopleuribacter pedis TaxID=442870 RepID=A0A8J7Q4R5_9BACT|nr:hypothetical protein [Acanthopleuribacter pedis]MBO1317791.1 hypothetical protein [Acanthopleuribacter pedis]